MNTPAPRSPGEQSNQRGWFLITLPLQAQTWLLAIIDLEQQVPIDVEVFPATPGAEEVWRKIKAMLREAESRGQPPAQIQVEPEWLRAAIRTHWQASSIPILPGSDQARRLAGTLFGDSEAAAELPGLLEVEGISPSDARAFFQAADSFYRALMQSVFAADEPIAVKVEPPGWKRYLILTGEGQAGAGLLIYEDLDRASAALDAEGPPVNLAPEQSVLVLTFERRQALPAADRQAARRFRWPIAGPDAYPLPLQLTAQGHERPGREELLFLEVILHALPDFFQNQLPGVLDGEETETTAEYEVNSRAGNSRVQLTYPADAADWLLYSDDNGAASIHEDGKKALGLAHQAWQAYDEDQRRELARQALALSPFAVEAYLVMAELEDFPAEALKWLEKAVQAGERWLPEAHAAQGKPLWSFRLARPYLNALQARAELLEQLGRGEAALKGYEKLLQINPPDHTGARYPALALLLRLNRNADAAALLNRYTQDDSPDWCFGRALLAFRAEGDSPTARRYLADAARRYPQALAYLTGKTSLPIDPDEAETQEAADTAAYALRSYPVWWSTPGAVDWIKTE